METLHSAGSGLCGGDPSNSLHDTSGQPATLEIIFFKNGAPGGVKQHTTGTRETTATARVLRQGGKHTINFEDTATAPSVSAQKMNLNLRSSRRWRLLRSRRLDAVDVAVRERRRFRDGVVPRRTNGTCACDEGFEWDPDYGSCGRPQFNTSAWTGLQRCPGYVTKDTALDPVDVLNLRYVYIADASNSTADEILAAKRKAGANISSLSVPGGMYTNGP